MFRRTENCDASLYWDNSKKIIINEWHLKREKIKNRKYSRDIPVWTSPALSIVNGIPMAYAGGCDQTLYALNLADKKIAWTKITNGNIIDSPIVANFAGQQFVLFSSSDRTVYCCEASSGRPIWTRELIQPSNTISGVTLSSPSFYDGKIYLNCFVYDKSIPRNEQKAQLFILSAFDGNILSKITITNGPVGPPLIFKIDENPFLVLCAKKGLLLCFDISSIPVRKIWSYQMPNEVLAAPVFLSFEKQNSIFIGSKYGSLISIDAKSGNLNWKLMTGNWIDNTACTGIIDNLPIVFTGSHDYNLYAINALTGEILWKTSLGGEIFSAPALFNIKGENFVVAAALNNHIYILNASNGKIVNSFFTGNPIWDKINKGETLWGSPSVLCAEDETAVIFGSTSGNFYVFPIFKDCTMSSMARAKESIWLSLLISGILIFFLIIFIIRTSKNFS